MEQDVPQNGPACSRGPNECVGTDGQGDVDGSDDELRVEVYVEQPSGIVGCRLGE
jgi:hypothetical protein